MRDNSIVFRYCSPPDRCEKCQSLKVISGTDATTLSVCPQCEWRCLRCNTVKNRGDFYRGILSGTRKKSNGKLYPRWGPCRDCSKTLNKTNAAARKESGKALSYERLESTKRIRLNTMLKREYGITLATYEQMALEQGGVCKICRKEETEVSTVGQTKPNRLSVDHDHETGKVRGLLCYKCNQAIGCLRHSIPLLNAAIQYLIESEGGSDEQSRDVRTE